MGDRNERIKVPYNRVDASFDIKSSYSEETNELKIHTHMVFLPFDANAYMKEMFYMDKAPDEKLMWLYCTLYNYIPIAIIKNMDEKISHDIYSGNWDEIDFWNNTEINISEDWSLGDYGMRDGHVYIGDLKERAVKYVTQKEDWYYTSLGKTFNFSNAINGSLLFSADDDDKGTKIDGFLETVKETIDDEEARKQYAVWECKGNKSTCSIELTTTLNVYGDHEQTYAVVYANPHTRMIYTTYIDIKKKEHEKIDEFQYVKDSLSLQGDQDKISVEIRQIENKTTQVVIHMKNGEWNALSPQIRFKLKHVVSEK